MTFDDTHKKYSRLEAASSAGRESHDGAAMLVPRASARKYYANFLLYSEKLQNPADILKTPIRHDSQGRPI